VSSWPELVDLNIIDSHTTPHDEEYTVSTYTQLASLTLGEGAQSDMVLKWLYDTPTVVSLQRLAFRMYPFRDFSVVVKFLAHPESMIKHLALTFDSNFLCGSDEYQWTLWQESACTFLKHHIAIDPD
jgi:hypothetical protein